MVRKVTLSVKIQAKVNFEGMGAKPLYPLIGRPFNILHSNRVTKLKNIGLLKKQIKQLMDINIREVLSNLTVSIVHYHYIR